MEAACDGVYRSRAARATREPVRARPAQWVMSTLATTRYSTRTTAHKATRRRLTGWMTVLQSEQIRASAGAGYPQ